MWLRLVTKTAVVKTIQIINMFQTLFKNTVRSIHRGTKVLIVIGRTFFYLPTLEFM